MNILVKVWGKDEVEERFYLQEEPFEFQHIDVAIHRVLDARVPQLPKEKPGHGGRGYLAASYYLIELLDGVVYDSIGERIDQSDEAQNFVFEVCKVVQPTTTPTTMRNWIRHFQEDILPTRPSEPETAFWLKTQ
jgi:hypothetical protein